MTLEGRAALVTGAGRRVGQAIAVGLARAGCDVAVHVHGTVDGGADTVKQIQALGRKAAAVAADLADPSAAQSLAGRAAGLLGGRLDILVNSAAIMVKQAVADVSPESWNRTLDLNLRAPFFVTQGAVPFLRASRGRVVNLADVAGLEPWPQYVPHCVSKAGVVMLTKGLARALA
ncbi:MAG TPA: SDR family NAD(P)-dependent oxidoreductase, partial [Gemmatimonadales bacterium]|nr:SDR family NAD(P)-dependent oxidoreductase [Gemmatimonadales bacterium]